MKSYSHMDQAAQQKVDIHEGIEDTLRLFAFKLEQGVKVERKYNKDIPKIEAFGSELNQVWTNLIDNAIDAVEEETYDGSTGKIVIRTCQKNNSLLIEVEDNGLGIPAEVKNRIL